MNYGDNEMDQIFIPKGGMCMCCVFMLDDCSGLPFKDYPVIKTEIVLGDFTSPSPKGGNIESRLPVEEIITVRCMNWRR